MFLLFCVSGENVYRCPLATEYTATSLSFHLDRYNFPRWQDDRDLSPPLQPSDSSSSSPKPRPRTRSREDWNPAAAQFVASESRTEKGLLVSKQVDYADKHAGGDSSSSAPTRKSQYEPLDLSCRPDSVPSHAATSPAVLQMSGLFNNGLSSSITRRLRSCSNAPAELGVKPSYHCDLLVQGTKGEMNSLNAGSVGHGDGSERSSNPLESDAPDKWKMLTNDVLEPKEVGPSGAELEAPREKNQSSTEQWGRAVAEPPIATFEGLTSGPAEPLVHQGALLSFLRSQGNLSSTSVGAQKANGGGNMEKDVASGEHVIYHIQRKLLSLGPGSHLHI